jgi:TolA-binding protein
MRRTGELLAIALVLAMASPAAAASMADLRAQARAVGISPGSGGAGEEAAIDRLGRIALQFLESADGRAPGAVEAYEAIAEPLERSHEAHRQALDQLSQRVVDQDGDMDALFESPTWRQHQALATQSLYYLNWLRYQGAQLFSGAKRKELLGEAATGFGEFATAGGESAIVIESHLGRGLANLELDQVQWAIADFEAVVNAKSAAPERVRKASLALGEAYIRAGRSGDALRTSQRALELATPLDQPRARLTRARALLMAAASQPGNKARYQNEARDLLTTVKSGGGPFGAQADRILRAGLDDPRTWAGPKAQPPAPPPPSEWDETKRLAATGKYAQAIPKLERIIASEDAEDRTHRREAQYLLGVALFKTGKLDAAEAAFDAVLAERETAYYRDDAAYLRFKIDESRYVANPTEQALPAYEQALSKFLAAYPQHKAAPEARFRLGEIRQRQERCPEAIKEYAQVKGDPAFELQATFATAQCAVRELEQKPEDAEPDPALRKTADEALARFFALLESHPKGDFRDAPVDDMSGRAALLGAYLAALKEPPDYERAVALLTDFETKYPALAEERPQVVKLRLAALVRLGRLEETAVEAERPEVADFEPAFLDHLSRRLLTTAARQKARGQDQEAAAGKKASRLLAERALASPAVGELSPLEQSRLRSTLASLYEESGEHERALAIYKALLAADPDAVSARAGAARVLESQNRASDARALWDEVATAPQGRAGWLEAHHQSARLSIALGEKDRACATLRAVPAEMLTNTNSPTPRKVQELLRDTCGA